MAVEFPELEKLSGPLSRANGTKVLAVFTAWGAFIVVREVALANGATPAVVRYAPSAAAVLIAVAVYEVRQQVLTSGLADVRKGWERIQQKHEREKDAIRTQLDRPVVGTKEWTDRLKEVAPNHPVDAEGLVKGKAISSDWFAVDGNRTGRLVFHQGRKFAQGGMKAVYHCETLLILNDGTVISQKDHVWLQAVGEEAQVVGRGLEVSRKVPSHANVITPLYWCDFNKELVISIEDYCTETLSSPKFSAWKPLVRMLEDVVRGLSHLHSHGVVHRDLKASNVLVTMDKSGNPVAKIRDLDTLEEANRQVKTVSGTLFYMAPECINTKIVTPKADIWSFAVMVYGLVMPLLDPKLPTVPLFILKANEEKRDYASFAQRLIKFREGILLGAPVFVGGNVISQTVSAIHWPDRMENEGNVFQEMVEKGLAIDPPQRPSAEGMKDRLGKLAYLGG